MPTSELFDVATVQYGVSKVHGNVVVDEPSTWYLVTESGEQFNPTEYTILRNHRPGAQLYQDTIALNVWGKTAEGRTVSRSWYDSDAGDQNYVDWPVLAQHLIYIQGWDEHPMPEDPE